MTVEEAHHYHSGYGLFCCECAEPFKTDEKYPDFLKRLAYNINLWRATAHVQGTCAVCGFLMANAFLNVAYWAEVDKLGGNAAGCPADPQRWHAISRPQVEAYVVPRIAWQKGTGKTVLHTLWDSNLVFEFGR